MSNNSDSYFKTNREISTALHGDPEFKMAYYSRFTRMRSQSKRVLNFQPDFSEFCCSTFIFDVDKSVLVRVADPGVLPDPELKKP